MTNRWVPVLKSFNNYIVAPISKGVKDYNYRFIVISFTLWIWSIKEWRSV